MIGDLIRFYFCVSVYVNDNHKRTWMLYDWMRCELTYFDDEGVTTEYMGRIDFWLSRPLSWSWVDSWQSPKVSISKEQTIWWERVKRIKAWES